MGRIDQVTNFKMHYQLLTTLSIRGSDIGIFYQGSRDAKGV
jgi:hypothetical protein